MRMSVGYDGPAGQAGYSLMPISGLCGCGRTERTAAEHSMRMSVDLSAQGREDAVPRAWRPMDIRIARAGSCGDGRCTGTCQLQPP